MNYFISLRAKIEAIITKTNYRPNLIARGLVKKRTDVIGLMVPRLDGYYTERIDAIMDTCDQHAYGLMIAGATGRFRGEVDNFYLLCEQQVAGIIYCAAKITEIHLEALTEIKKYMPIVTIDQYSPELKLPSVIQDNYQGARQALEYLLQLGHRKIAFIGSATYDSAAGLRDTAYYDFCKEHGLPIRQEWVCKGNFSIQSGYDIMNSILQVGDDRPTALFAANDSMAIGAINAIYEHGLGVPDDLSVIGFDDIPIAAHFRPSLTTVRQEQYTIGVRATEKIIEVINKKKANEIVTCMPLQLIVRDSTKSI